MEEIASRCGLGKGTLYEYFATKEDLFIEVCLTGFVTSAADIERAFEEEDDARKALEGVIDALFDETPLLLEKMPLYFTLWGRLSFDPRHRRSCRQGFRNLYEGFRSALAGGLEKARRQGSIREDLDCREMASAIISIFDGYLYQRVFASRDLGEAGMKETLRRLILEGLLPRASTGRARS